MLAWVLEEPPGDAVATVLTNAERVVASVVTPLECGRALRRGPAVGRLTVTQAAEGEQLLHTLVAGWTVVELNEDIRARALGPFTHEPVRTLDAVHLATADVMRRSLGPIAMLSLDARVRRNAAALGMIVLP